MDMRRSVFVCAFACAFAFAAVGCSDDSDGGGTVPDGGDVIYGSTSGTGGSGGSGGSSTGTGGSGGTGGTGGSGGSGGDTAMDDGGTTDAMVSLPPASDCGRIGDACTGVDDCCSGICDTARGACVSSLGRCANDGDACASPTDCCNLACGADGRCGATACKSDGDTCSADADCCGRSCMGGTCAPLNDTCHTSGNDCSASSECCSGYCSDSKCQLSASFCIQEGDICTRAADCCTGRCDIVTGRDVGVCGPPPSGASFCNDGVEGSICDSCNDCCSRLCAPYGPTGVNVCQPASGCHVTGDFCRQDRDCCGADGTGLPGEGNVYCEKDTGSDLGICRNPMSCSPQGNVCHYKDYTCGVSSARANCCGGLGAKGGVCQLDPLGVPRCNGLGDECIAAGEICASADDCCDDVPCTPDAQGVLRCFEPPPGEPPCVPKDGGCTINADCCPGNTCTRPVGSTVGTCNPTTQPPPPPPDAGTNPPPDAGTNPPPDAGTPTICSEYGQTCQQTSDCCNGVPCTTGICRVPFG